jgi:LmbE family N-acetylglucosaminyl deacetylase
MERILAFACHPDDVEWQMGGTLALLAERGYEIHVADIGGEVGHYASNPQEIRARRLRENTAAAAKIGGKFHYAGGHDLEIQYDAAHRRMAVRIVREVDPMIVLSPPPSDYLIDHEETSRLVRNAAYIASVPHYDCGVPTVPTKRIPYLYYCNAAGGSDIFGRPLPLHFGIDVTSVFPLKREMLACHESQREWLLYHNKFDNYVDTMEEGARQQGKLIGVEFAECYIQHVGQGHPKDNILKEILGGLCVELPR